MKGTRTFGLLQLRTATCGELPRTRALLSLFSYHRIQNELVEHGGRLLSAVIKFRSGEPRFEAEMASRLVDGWLHSTL